MKAQCRSPASADQIIIIAGQPCAESKMEDRFGSSPDAVMSSVPLSRDMTLAEFVVLGVNALVYVRRVTGEQLAKLLAEPEIASNDTFQLVIAADGALLLVTDNPEELDNWLDEMNFGVVSLH